MVTPLPTQGDKLVWVRHTEAKPLAVRDLPYVTVLGFDEINPNYLSLEETPGLFNLNLFKPYQTTAAGSHVHNEALPAPTWGYAETVGNLIEQLRTIDPQEAIVGAYHVHHEEGGPKRCKTRGLILSKEHVKGTNVTGDKSDPLVNVLWSAPLRVGSEKSVLTDAIAKVLDGVSDFIVKAGDDPHRNFTREEADLADAVSHLISFIAEDQRPATLGITARMLAMG